MDTSALTLAIASHLEDPVFLAFWLLGIPFFFVIFRPESRWTRPVAFGFTAICGILYIVLILSKYPNPYDAILCTESTQAFAASLSHRAITVAIYLQIVGWDLTVGHWLSLDAKRVGFQNRLRIPFLIVFMFFPPFCFTIYLIARYLRTGRLPTLKTVD